jgi:hypothetical protein
VFPALFCPPALAVTRLKTIHLETPFHRGYFTTLAADMTAGVHKPLPENDLPVIPYFIFSPDVPEGALLQIAGVFLQEHFVIRRVQHRIIFVASSTTLGGTIW